MSSARSRRQRPLRSSYRAPKLRRERDHRAYPAVGREFEAQSAGMHLDDRPRQGKRAVAARTRSQPLTVRVGQRSVVVTCCTVSVTALVTGVSAWSTGSVTVLVTKRRHPSPEL